ncbi:MAG: HNH endonuclease [Polyangiaceae bacterium]|nr:HNH endonuclease [Polyangiaceae bacterium]
MTRARVPAAVERRVRERAGNRCEYCKLAQIGQEAVFHIDHVFPRKHGGDDTLENLALACVSCSLRKGARIDASDPVTGKAAPLFNPRREVWANHFELAVGPLILGKTPTGRATADLLKMNRPEAISIRYEESLRGRYSFPE